MRQLSSSIIESVKKKVVKDFPELAGIEPTCSLKKTETRIAEKLSVSLPKRAKKAYVLTFSKQMAAEGFQIARVVRATVTGDGNIIKVTVSK